MRWLLFFYKVVKDFVYWIRGMGRDCRVDEIGGFYESIEGRRVVVKV